MANFVHLSFGRDLRLSHGSCAAKVAEVTDIRFPPGVSPLKEWQLAPHDQVIVAVQERDVLKRIGQSCILEVNGEVPYAVAYKVDSSEPRARPFVLALLTERQMAEFGDIARELMAAEESDCERPNRRTRIGTRWDLLEQKEALKICESCRLNIPDDERFGRSDGCHLFGSSYRFFRFLEALEERKSFLAYLNSSRLTNDNRTVRLLELTSFHSDVKRARDLLRSIPFEVMEGYSPTGDLVYREIADPVRQLGSLIKGWRFSLLPGNKHLTAEFSSPGSVRAFSSGTIISVEYPNRKPGKKYDLLLIEKRDSGSTVGITPQGKEIELAPPSERSPLDEALLRSFPNRNFVPLDKLLFAERPGDEVFAGELRTLEEFASRAWNFDGGFTFRAEL